MEQKASFGELLNELVQGSVAPPKKEPGFQRPVNDALELSTRASRHKINSKTSNKSDREFPPPPETETRTDLQGNSARLSREANALASANPSATAWETPHDKYPGGKGLG